MSESNETRQEIVIIRRKAADDTAAGKGGAWKIAYADFVTAMMAFFLVMWLINASNEATRAQVASYFNPIKLTDPSTGERGLTDSKRTPGSKTHGVPEAELQKSGSSEKQQEDELLADPGKALDRIIEAGLADTAVAKEQQAGIVQSKPPSGEVTSTGDPFDPKSWEAVSASSNLPEGWQSKNVNLPVSPVTVAPESASRQSDDQVDSAPPAPASDPSMPKDDAAGQQRGQLPQEGDGFAAQEKEAEQIKKEILKTTGLASADISDAIEVVPVRDGVTISLIEKHLFGMFKTGSAEPEPQLVSLIETVAGVLQKHPGRVAVRGHTDSKSYRNRKYDNWQLSTARAHMAQYILVRGGLSDLRIHRVEGVADREPRIPENPEAAENRRIDIFLEMTQ